MTVDVNNVMEWLFDAGAVWLRNWFVIINLLTRCVYFKLLRFFMW